MVSPLVVCQQGAPFGFSPVISVGVFGLCCTSGGYTDFHWVVE